MPTLTKFRLVGVHLVGALSGIYIAAGTSRLFAWFSPAASRIAFIIAALFFVTSEVCMTIRELHKGRLSTGIIILDCLPGVLLFTGVSLFLSTVAGRVFGSDWAGMVLFWGIEVTVIGFLGAVKESVHARDLKEDLEHPRPPDPEEDARERRRYLNPYI
jgi:hypothetical protein